MISERILEIDCEIYDRILERVPRSVTRDMVHMRVRVPLYINLLTDFEPFIIREINQ